MTSDSNPRPSTASEPPIPLHVTRWGAGPPVVLVHGGAPSAVAAFAAQRPLSARWELVLPDRPGHGASPSRGRSDFERDAALLLDFLDGGAHLVGHSYGAVVALYMAMRRPSAVRSLVLIEPPAFSVAPDDPEVAAMANANRELFERPPDDPAERLRRLFAIVGIDRSLPEPLPSPLVGVAGEMGKIRGPWEAEIDLNALRGGGYPTCLLTSGRTLGFERIAQALSQAIAAAHIVIPGTDHAVQDAGERVNPVLESLWTRAEAAGA